MFRSFLQLSLRTLFRKHRLFTLVNISGLSIGLACFLLVALFIYNEYHYDSYHRHADRIYRIALDFNSEGNVVSWAKTSAPIGRYLSGAYPEAEQVVRLRKNPGTDLLTYNEANFYEERIFFADSTLFNVFDIDLIKGNPLHALRAKHSVILSEDLARKFFGNDDPIGKTIRFNNQVDLKITGIMKAMPPDSHFIADAFITFSSLDEILGEKRLSHWGQFDHYTYVLLAQDASPAQLEAKFPDLLRKNAPEWVSEKERLYLQPLRSIHLHSALKDEITPNSNEKYSYILGTIALFILFMACANFINLSTATQLSRYKEITIRKILGAGSTNLSLYFWFESFLISFFALCAAFVIAHLLLPDFNFAVGKQISWQGNYWIIPLSLTATIVIALLSGFFPALQSQRLHTAQVNKFQISGGNKSRIRTSLVTFQFFTSIFLIIATWIVSSQLNFLESSRIGFDSDNVVVIPIKDRSQNDRHKTIINEIAQLPGIDKVSFSSSTPGSNNSFTYTYTFVGTESGEQAMATFIVDENFFDLYNIRLKEGRLLNLTSTDTLSEVIINTAAAEQYKLTDPIGQVVTGKVKGRIVGVIENFNHTSLHDAFQPVIMYAFTPTFRFASVKVKEGQAHIALSGLEKRWPQLFPGFPLEYTFLDDQIQQLYGAEGLLRKAYTSFSLIAIIIAGVGLIGLTSYTIERKRREISIRKVFGGTTWQIVQWIYSGYVSVIVIATLIAWGLGYYWMNRWLSGFAHKIELTPLYFIIPVGIMIFILMITTGLQTIYASVRNPVVNLREE